LGPTSPPQNPRDLGADGHRAVTLEFRETSKTYAGAVPVLVGPSGSNEVAVTKATADKLGLKNISDLQGKAQNLSLHGSQRTDSSTIESVNKNLTADTLQELNARVDLDKETPQQAAAAYLKDFGYVQ